MAQDWEYEMVGWQDVSGARHDESPPADAIGSMDGVMVHAWDARDPEADRYFWVYHPDVFESWDEADQWIHDVGDQYGSE